MWRRCMGRLLTQGDPEALQILRAAASDSCWRAREGVAMALQHFGDTDMGALLSEMERWSEAVSLKCGPLQFFYANPDC